MTTADRRRRWLLFGIVATVIAVADQLTKAWVVQAFRTQTEIIGDFVRITIVHNTGGIFGLFGQSATLLAIASSIVIGVIFVYQARAGAHSHWLLSGALGLLLGGAVGNLIDRLRLGYVIDFVDMGIGEVRWYIFNVADAAISTSLLLFILLAFFGERLTRRLERRPAH